jgi:hypothetical protein
MGKRNASQSCSRLKPSICIWVCCCLSACTGLRVASGSDTPRRAANAPCWSSSAACLSCHSGRVRRLLIGYASRNNRRSDLGVLARKRGRRRPSLRNQIPTIPGESAQAELRPGRNSTHGVPTHSAYATVFSAWSGLFASPHSSTNGRASPNSDRTTIWRSGLSTGSLTAPGSDTWGARRDHGCRIFKRRERSCHRRA